MLKQFSRCEQDFGIVSEDYNLTTRALDEAWYETLYRNLYHHDSRADIMSWSNDKLWAGTQALINDYLYSGQD